MFEVDRFSDLATEFERGGLLTAFRDIPYMGCRQPQNDSNDKLVSFFYR